jgi:PTH1 family peptidyl-tRNA hydrolase
MLLLVGLGNPGEEYAGNRHNVGFMVADAVHRRFAFAPYRRKFEGDASEGSLGEERALILKPATYMNESGRAVGAAARFYKLEAADVVVIHDEIDLAPGKLRIKTGGGVAGHNGLRSIASHIGPDFRRVRIGVGHPGDKDRVHGHVLSDFSKADREWVEKVVDAIAEAVPTLVLRDDAAFSNRVALILKPPMPKGQPKEGAKARKETPADPEDAA